MISSRLSGFGPQKFIQPMLYASAMMRSANPKAWKVSTLRGWMPSACPSGSRPSRFSMMRVEMPGYWDICAASSIPAGPEPTMSTSISSGRSDGRSVPMPAASCTRGSAET